VDLANLCRLSALRLVIALFNDILDTHCYALLVIDQGSGPT